MVRVDHVVALAPHTFLGNGLRRLHGEHRFAKRVAAAQQHAVTRRHLDAKPVMRRNRGATRFHVYYPTGHALDSRHAGRLEKINGVTLHPVDSDDHTFMRAMRVDGSLMQLLLMLTREG